MIKLKFYLLVYSLMESFNLVTSRKKGNIYTHNLCESLNPI